MSPEELERAIVAPADQAGLVVEPRLLAEMIADVADWPGALPLLQYALTELAERAEGGMLTLDAYRRIGRVSGALARRAEALFGPMNAAGRDACRQLFLRLVTLGEGTEDTRRRVRRSELALADAQTMDAVIETYGRHRLLSFDRDPDTREPTVEIAHEALLREWGRLRGWIDDAREELRQRARISAATAEWEQAEGNSEYLMTGPRLAQAEEASHTVRLTDTEREFLDASIAHRDAEAAAKRMRHARELSLERRARTRLRGLVAVLAAGLLLAASLTAVAVNRSREAQRRSDEAAVLGLTGAALSNLQADPDLSLQLALQAVDLSSDLGDPVPRQTVEALHWALQESGIQYPNATGPVATAASPFGYRGVFDLPVSDLANLGLAHVQRSQRSDACARFFGKQSCPALPSRFEMDLRSESLGGRPERLPSLAGTTVTLNLATSAVGLADVRAELRGFTDATGIEVQLVGNPDQESWLDEVLAAGDPPDIAQLGQPGGVASLGREGHLMDLGIYLNADRLRREQSPYLVSLGTVGSDGSWPADDGAMYAVFNSLSVKSLIWYPVPEFRSADYAIPGTWDELLSLADRLAADGRTPWCMGWISDQSNGWPGTDWIENLLLAEAGTDVYDQWTFHRIPFDAPAVRAAFDRFGQIVFDKDALQRGPQGVLETPFAEAQLPMIIEHPPGCWLYQFADFAAEFLPDGSVGTETTIFPFPTIGGGERGVLGGGNMLAAFTDRPEVREVLRFLLSPEFGAEMAAKGHGYLSPDRNFDTSLYAPFWRKQAELIETR
jgi:ABC-type glycerol-3-phosphate transport system substrate-binding protein